MWELGLHLGIFVVFRMSPLSYRIASLSSSLRSSNRGQCREQHSTVTPTVECELNKDPLAS